MRKKLSYILVAVVLVLSVWVGLCRAEGSIKDIVDKIPALNQSVIFSLDKSEFDYAVSVTLVQLLNKKISIDLGYSPSAEVLGLISFKLINVKDYLTFPILDKAVIEPFVYVGAKRIENLKEFGEYDYGIGAKIINLKF